MNAVVDILLYSIILYVNYVYLYHSNIFVCFFFIPINIFLNTLVFFKENNQL